MNEYIALQYLLGRESLKFGMIISENVGVSSAIKGAIRVNPYNLDSIVNALDRVYFMKEEERVIKFKKDLEYILDNTTFAWIKKFFVDLKRIATVIILLYN